MKLKIKSPDDALLLAASHAMRLSYALFRVSPLAYQFWPPLAAVAVSAVAFVYIGMTKDTTYFILAGICAFWTRMFHRDHATLLKDSRSEWNADLYRKYALLADLLRTRAEWVRLLMLSAAVLVTTFVIAGTFSELDALEPWQRGLFPMNMWALAFLAYARSAEPPRPDDGDLFLKPSASGA